VVSEILDVQVLWWCEVWSVRCEYGAREKWWGDGRNDL
jgi:hypothetical protein